MAKMAFLPAICCAVLVSLAWGGPLDTNENLDQNDFKKLEEILSARRMERKEDSETSGGDTTGNEEITVKKMGEGRAQIDITSNNKLIEQHLLDCNQKYEIIVMSDDGTGKGHKACYLHEMEDALYDSACLGKGDRTDNVYNIGDQILEKDFLSADGPDSVCRDVPMFQLTEDTDQNQDTASKRELNKRGCDYQCGINAEYMGTLNWLKEIRWLIQLLHDARIEKERSL